jgi:hypothetical protein
MISERNTILGEQNNKKSGKLMQISNSQISVEMV